MCLTHELPRYYYRWYSILRLGIIGYVVSHTLQVTHAKEHLSDQTLMVHFTNQVTVSTILHFLPALDLRALHYNQKSEIVTQTLSLKDLETTFTKTLKDYPNLKVNTSTYSFKLLKKSRLFKKELQLARQLARNGILAYREVDLDRAYTLLQSALEIFQNSNILHFYREELAQIYMTLALISLEKSQILQASQFFSLALIYHPKLRLRKSLDGEKAYNLFESTLNQLRDLSSLDQVALVQKHMPILSDESHLLMIRTTRTIQVLLKVKATQGELKLSLTRKLIKKAAVVTSKEPVIVMAETLASIYPTHVDESKANTQDPTIQAKLGTPSTLKRQEVINRLASKVWFCLPFKRRPKVQKFTLSHIRLSMGWRNFIFAQAPVDLFQNIGFGAELTWLTQHHLSWLLGFTWSNSNRDQQEDLRQDINQGQLYLGPQWQSHLTGVRFLASLNIEVRYLAAIKMSREVGCKHFNPSSYLPPVICQPSQDMTQLNPSWRISPRLQVGVFIPLSNTLHLNIASYIAKELYTYQDSPFRTPIGILFSLGYHFYQ